MTGTEPTREMWRLFIALPVPDDVKEELRRIQSKLRQMFSGANIRWSPTNQIHLTLVFLGNVPVGRVGEVTGISRQVCAKYAPLRLSAERIGFFPERVSPRVIVVGVRDASAQLAPLREALAAALDGYAEKRLDKPFSPHLTLARVNRMGSRESRLLKESARELPGQSLGAWRAAAVAIMRSELSSDGARHELLAEAPLGNTLV